MSDPITTREGFKDVFHTEKGDDLIDVIFDNKDDIEGLSGGGGTIQESSSDPINQASTDSLIKCDTSSNDIVVNLLAASVWAGRRLDIKKMSNSNKVTINPSGAELIDGAITFDFFNADESITIQSDGTGVVIV